jgi:outer membrane protein OmpA-like peptidoglycan-associated protein
MKLRPQYSVLLLGALLCAPFASAHADSTPGWYVDGGIGGNYNPDSKTDNRGGHTTLDYNPGYDVEGGGGYAWSNGLRAEGEVWHSRADMDKVKGGGNTNGHLENTDVFGNLFYDFKTGTMLTPYVGAGVGVALADASNIGTLRDGSSLNDSSNLQLAYQAIGGVAAQLDNHWAVTADYRYVATTDPRFHTTAGYGSRTDNESHNVVLGVRYSFDEPAPVAKPAPVYAPSPRPAQASAPVVAPVPQSYMVFFDFDKSVLTPEAKSILASAAQDFKRSGFVKVVVTGHTDTKGSVAFNQKLSSRRANAVRAELVKLGLPANMVQPVGVGKNGLLVPTNDQVREAQNRRAEIVFSK